MLYHGQSVTVREMAYAHETNFSPGWGLRLLMVYMPCYSTYVLFVPEGMSIEE